MARRKTKGGGLVGMVSMSGFAGARQPKGLADVDRRRLQTEGHLSVLQEPIETDSAPTPTPQKPEDAASEPSGTGESPPKSGDSVDCKAVSKTTKARRKKRARSTATQRTGDKSRPKRRRGNAQFVLPPQTADKTGARSCHFRLPPEIEAKLAEIAQEHSCSKTHVVCAAIESTWKRFDRQRRRASK